jgi:sulfur relay (sulfurtransferase) complex TusBCD TusD component (DsrE family)
MDNFAFPARLSASVPTELAEAVNAAAAARGISTADFLRGAVQARLFIEGARFSPLPNLQRLAPRAGRARTT